MKNLNLLRLSAALCMALALAACASNKPRPDKPVEVADQPSKEAPASAHKAPGNDGPQQAPTPGGYWPPKPIDDSAPVEPLPKMPSTDEVSLDAQRDPKAELKQRAIERWAFLIAKRGEVAFEYLTPGYQSTHDKVKYARDMADRPVLWYRATFDRIDCASDVSCEVSMLVDFRVRMTAGMGVTSSFSYVKERWIATDGVWYHLPTEAGG